MLHQHKIRAVIFDIGGVLIRTEDVGPRTRLALRYGLDRAGLDEVVFGSPTAQAAERGQFGEEDVWAAVAARLSLDDSGLAEFRTQFWAGDRLDVELLDWLIGLRPAYKTALLSNAWARDLSLRFSEGFGVARERIEQGLDALVSSAVVGVQKPDAHMYQAALDALGVQAQEAVFVDDFQRNIDGALRLGMHAILFKSADALKIELSRLLGRV